MDYKIISKVITLRLSRVLHRIIEPDQTCSIPGRSIFSNVYLIRDVLDYIEQTDEAAILVSLDQEKAFDRWEDHRAIIRYVSNDVRKRVKLDFIPFSESRFSRLWLIPGFCTRAGGQPSMLI